MEYQARAVCQWSRNAFYQYGRDVFKADSWTKLFKDIKDQDSICKEIATTLDAGLWEQTIQSERQQLQVMLQSWCDEERRTLKDLQDSMRKLHNSAEDQRKQQQSVDQRREETDCHQSFGPMNYRDHKDQNPSRVPGTCAWFLGHQSFLDWKQETSSAVLWVSADPGCGKSVLMKSMIDEDLLGDDKMLSSVCYFFFKDGFVDQQGLAICISALLHQLFSQKPHLIKFALPYFRRDRQVADNFSVAWDIFVQAASAPEAGEIICVLDALDECEERSREQLIETFKRLYLDDQKCSEMKLKFLVSSRPYPIIERRFRALIKEFPSIHLRGEQESETISQEINLVIEKRVPEIAVELDLSIEAQQSLLESLLRIPNRTYLWLHLIFEAILKSVGASSPKALAKIIGQLPESVDEAYDKILARATNLEQCRKLLHLILAAQEPLTLAQMNVALHVDEGARSVADLDLEDEEHFEKTVRGLCGLFVSVVGSKLFLIHQTAREYLQMDIPQMAIDDPQTARESMQGNIHLTAKEHLQSNQTASTWKHSIDPYSCDAMLARSCILYLHFTDFRLGHPTDENDDDSTIVRRRYSEGCGSSDGNVNEQLDSNNPIRPLFLKIRTISKNHPFFGYTATKWMAHLKESSYANEYPDVELLKLAIDLCDPKSKNFLTWFVYYEKIRTPGILFTPDPELSVLLVATITSSTRIVQNVFSEVDHSTTSGVTASMIAAHNDNRVIFRLLLGAGADIETSDRDGWRPIHYAIPAGHFYFIRDHLGDADVNLASRDGTPLVLAVYRGERRLVRLLCDRGAEINAVSRGRALAETP